METTTESESERTPITPEQLQQAVDAGAEAAKINSAIDELKAAYSNAGNKYEACDSALFDALTQRREELRALLLAMD